MEPQAWIAIGSSMVAGAALLIAAMSARTGAKQRDMTVVQSEIIALRSEVTRWKEKYEECEKSRQNDRAAIIGLERENRDLLLELADVRRRARADRRDQDGGGTG